MANNEERSYKYHECENEIYGTCIERIGNSWFMTEYECSDVLARYHIDDVGYGAKCPMCDKPLDEE